MDSPPLNSADLTTPPLAFCLELQPPNGTSNKGIGTILEQAHALKNTKPPLMGETLGQQKLVQQNKQSRTPTSKYTETDRGRGQGRTKTNGGQLEPRHV
jgi:hypothetical protein